MGRERVLRDAQRPGDVAGGKSLWFMPHKQPERLEPSWLRERRETGERRFYFHNSRYIDIYDAPMTFSRCAANRLLAGITSVTQACCQEHFAWPAARSSPEIGK